MRISDWSSDVCSSDLLGLGFRHHLFEIGILFVSVAHVAAACPLHDQVGGHAEQVALKVLDAGHVVEREHACERLLRELLSVLVRWQPRAQVADQRPMVAAIQRVDSTGMDGFGASRAKSEEHTSELQSLMRISYAVFCLKKKKK